MDEVRPGYYAVIPADVRYDDRLPANAKLLYGEISALIGKDGYCFASNQYFADLYKCTARTVSGLVSALEEAGYIKIELEREESGKVSRRRLYLSASAPDAQPVENIFYTPGKDFLGGIEKNFQYTNTSITNIEKENKKEKDGESRGKRTPLTDGKLQELFVSWIGKIAADDWSRDEKNSVYFALKGFYEPRASKKQEPARTEAAFTALSNRLIRFSDGSPAVMVDMLERATGAGWRSVFPIGGDRAESDAPQGGGRDVVWL